MTFVRSIMASRHLVRDIAFAPDGKTLVAGSGDGTLKIFDAVTGESVRSLPGHTGSVNGVTVTQDGRKASSVGDHTIRVWSLPDGKPVRTIDATTGLYALGLSPDGQSVVTGCENGTVKVWTLDGALVATLAHGTGKVLSTTFSPDGSRVITAGDDKFVKAWTTADWKLQRTFTGHAATVDQALVAPDGQTLISASDDRTVRLWHLETGRLFETLSLHTNEVWTLGVSPNDGTLVTGGRDARLGVWALPWGRLEQDIQLNENSMTSAIAFSPDGLTVASGHSGVIYLWRLARGVVHPALPQPMVTSVVLASTATPDERAYAEVTHIIDSYAGQGEVLDVATGRLQLMLKDNPRSARAFAGLSRVAYRRAMRSSDDYDAAQLKTALDMADRAIAIDPSLPEAHCARGFAAWKAKDDPGAHAAAATALKLAPKMPRALLLSANLQVSDGDLDGAESTLRDMLSRPLTPALALWALEVLSDVYEKLGDYAAADQTYRYQMVVEPDRAWTIGNYAHFLIRKGDFDAAIVTAKKALAQMDYGVGRYILAEAYCAKGEEDLWDRTSAPAALEAFQAALTASPTFARAAYDIGACHQYLGKTGDKSHLGQARTFYEKALALDPNDKLAAEALASLR
jgi:WD40 repeat protein/tetratricopeptide (TPR) repeat protein